MILEKLRRKKFRCFALTLAAFLAGSVVLAAVPAFVLHAKADESEEEDYTVLQPEDIESIEEARASLQPIVQEREIMALVYLCDAYDVREAAGMDSAVAATVFCGQTVNIVDVEIVESAGMLTAWAKVSFYSDGGQRMGYIERNYLACSDERFLTWEAEYGMNPGTYTLYAGEPLGAAAYADVEQFPASYKAALNELKTTHPKWIFVPMNTGLDWQTVINNEMKGGKSLIHSSFADCMKEGSYDGGNWYYASEEILKFYMDPRNALTEDRIFQFELLTYNETYHTLEAVEQFLDNTFMNRSKKAPGTIFTFGEIFWNLGKEDKRLVSPFHLAARVYQEQGKGDSPLISGTYTGQNNTLYGYYNYFNIGATGKSNEEYIVKGLTYAKDKDWSNAYASIMGGADIITQNYIQKGQDTLYLEKFNVNPSAANALFTHQYMQNITAPTTEGDAIKKLYASANSLDNTFVFKIPVYNNMPASACPKPTASTNVTVQVPKGYDTTVWLDGVQYAPLRTESSRVVVKAPNGNAKSAVVYQYDKSGVPTGMYLWTLNYAKNAYQVTAQPQLENLLTYHGCSIRITGKAGIRFKTGISAALRDQLTGAGINGYHLKEYGTLVMNNANRSTYPMIRGGEKVSVGMAYGLGADGKQKDAIYETVSGRHRFTSVLVGLPADQYKVEYAFRGYLVLEKDGVETVVYGPVVARNIYALAQQVLNMGTYPAGSAAETFLQQLIDNAL